MERVQTEWNQVSAADVVAFFVQGYQLKPGERLAGHEYFYDAAKGQFLFKLTIERPDAIPQENEQ